MDNSVAEIAKVTEAREVIEEVNFLPQSLVMLLIKIAKNFKLSVYEEFSLFETISYGLSSNASEDFDEEKLSSLLLEIIKVTQKYNNADLKLSNENLGEIFGKSTKDLVQEEFAVFKSMNYKIKSSKIIEMIYLKIEKHLSDHKKKDFLYSYSIDILRFVFMTRDEIYKS